MSELSVAELEMYARHLSLNEVGVQGQLKLKNAKILVVGAGGLGCPILMYLAAAGIGNIGIVEFDLIEKSNLQRQVLFGWRDIGKSKAFIAKERIGSMNPYIEVNTHECRIDSGNVLDIIKDYDIVIDGSDNFPTKFLLNDACFLTKKPLIYGSISQFEGQLSVFNWRSSPEQNLGPNYRDIFPEPPPPGLSQNCAEAGVIGVLPGLLGCLQTNEAIKIVTGIGDILSGKMLVIDALSLQMQLVKIKCRSSNPLSGTKPSIFSPYDLEYHCTVTEEHTENNISSKDLYEKIQRAEDFSLIDVRETYEHAISSIGGVSIPLAELDKSIPLIDSRKLIVFYCKSGKRSEKAVATYSKLVTDAVCVSLSGGIDRFLKEYSEFTLI